MDKKNKLESISDDLRNRLVKYCRSKMYIDNLMEEGPDSKHIKRISKKKISIEGVYDHGTYYYVYFKAPVYDDIYDGKLSVHDLFVVKESIDDDLSTNRLENLLIDSYIKRQFNHYYGEIYNFNKTKREVLSLGIFAAAEINYTRNPDKGRQIKLNKSEQKRLIDLCAIRNSVDLNLRSNIIGAFGYLVTERFNTIGEPFPELSTVGHINYRMQVLNVVQYYAPNYTAKYSVVLRYKVPREDNPKYYRYIAISFLIDPKYMDEKKWSDPDDIAVDMISVSVEKLKTQSLDTIDLSVNKYASNIVPLNGSTSNLQQAVFPIHTVQQDWRNALYDNAHQIYPHTY